MSLSRLWYQKSYFYDIQPMDALCVFCVCVYSGYAFMLSIQAIHSCYLFRLFIHAIYSGYSFRLSIQAIHSGHIRFGSKRNFEFFKFQDTQASGPSDILIFFTKVTFFKDRLKRCFDSGFVIYAKFRVDLYPGFIQRCFLRRVMAEQR